jgi:hypothetical protein
VCDILVSELLLFTDSYLDRYDEAAVSQLQEQLAQVMVKLNRKLDKGGTQGVGRVACRFEGCPLASPVS